MKKVAVVILNWNGVAHLKQFLPSVVEHTTSELADVVVADNGSTDESISFLRKEYPSVQLIQLDQNYGFAGGYNKAILQIKNEYTVLLNSDVEVTPNWLEPLVNAMEKNEKMAACQPKVRAFRNRPYFEHAGAAGGFIDTLGYPFCRGRIMDNTEEDKGQYDSLMPIFWATGACMMVRTNQFLELGGLDDRFFAHMEEIDWCWRMKNNGGEVWTIPSSTVFHLGGATLGYESPRKVYLNFRNSLFMLGKNLHRKEFLSKLFIRMILDGVAAFKFLLEGKGSFFMAILRAHMAFYSNCSYWMKERKKLPNKILLKNHSGVLNGSIVWHYFVKKHQKFSDLF
ncbi:glycosyltransferase family 2 protein [Prolixibacteraceae bacterium JC049]|nr:glycosyltransferase family 2 protein [Prolixibacteraceae bacterium JC049]